VSELRGIILRPEAGALLVRPTAGELAAFAEGTPVSVREERASPWRRQEFRHIRGDGWSGYVPRDGRVAVVDSVGVALRPDADLSARPSVAVVDARDVSRHMRDMREGQWLYDAAGRPVAVLDAVDYLSSPHERPLPGAVEYANQFIRGAMRYELRAVGPWRWR
jgi:hypothetical protein